MAKQKRSIIGISATSNDLKQFELRSKEDNIPIVSVWIKKVLHDYIDGKLRYDLTKQFNRG
jgi:hypothetical protein